MAITADQQDAQGRVVQVLTEGVLGHWRGQEADVQWLRQPPGEQFVNVFIADLRGRHVQGRACTECRPDLPGHRVKAKPGDAAGVAARVQAKGLAMPVHQVSAATLRSANNLKTDELKVGQVLTIPGTELAAQ